VDKKYVAWAAFIIYCVIIFVGSSIPGDRIDIDGPGIDKLIHTVEYSILSLLLFISLRLSSAIKSNAIFWISAISSSLYGLSDEIHQLFVPLREFDVLDIVCNTSGSILGAYVMFRYLNKDSRYPFKS
jgi:VanZ family protein